MNVDKGDWRVMFTLGVNWRRCGYAPGRMWTKESHGGVPGSAWLLVLSSNAAEADLAAVEIFPPPLSIPFRSIFAFSFSL